MLAPRIPASSGCTSLKFSAIMKRRQRMVRQQTVDRPVPNQCNDRPQIVIAEPPVAQGATKSAYFISSPTWTGFRVQPRQVGE